MCTLTIDWRRGAAIPVVVAANRDEVTTRPASGARWWPEQRFVAPVDEEAHGTWLGLNAQGVFVGVTNRFGNPRLLGRESRGALVVEALGAVSAQGLHARLATLAATRFNAFHLLYVDANDAVVTWSDGEQVRPEVRAEGVTVVTERSLGGDDRARTETIRARYPARRSDGTPDVAALERLLATKGSGDPLGDVCVDVPAFDYGTRSSLVLALAAELGRSRWFAADGRPDRTPFIERPELIEALGPGAA